MAYDPDKFYPVDFSGHGWLNTVRIGADGLGISEEETESVLEHAFYQEWGVECRRVERQVPLLVVEEENAEFIYNAAEAVLAVTGMRGALLLATRHKLNANRLVTNLNLSNYRGWRAAVTVQG